MHRHMCMYINIWKCYGKFDFMLFFIFIFTLEHEGTGLGYMPIPEPIAVDLEGNKYTNISIKYNR